MLRDDRLRGAVAGHSEPKETTAVATYIRIDWLTLVGRLRPAVTDLGGLLASRGATVRAYDRHRGTFQPYRSTAELPGGLLVHFGPCRPFTPAVAIDFVGETLESGLGSAAFRHAVAPLLVPASVSCTRLDIAIDYAVPPIRLMPFAVAKDPTEVFQPTDGRKGYAWPALHVGSVPNVRIGTPRGAVTVTVYDKTARVVDQLWRHARPWCQHHFDPPAADRGLHAQADLASVTSSLRRVVHPPGVLTKSVRNHERVTRIEARLRLRSTKARSLRGLFTRVDDPFAKLGVVDLLAVKQHNELWYRALLQARLVGLDLVLAELDAFGFSRARARVRLRELALLSTHASLDSPSCVFARARATLQRQLGEIVGPIVDAGIEGPTPPADFGSEAVYLPQMPRPPMPPPRSPRTLPAGALLRDNRSRGARLVVVMAVDGDRVRGYDQRTGRRTSFQLECVGPASARFTVVPPGQVDEALRRMRDHRLRSLGTNVVHLADHRSGSGRARASTSPSRAEAGARRNRGSNRGGRRSGCCNEWRGES